MMSPSNADVSRLYRALLDAWNERDAAAYARLFASDGSIVGFDGSAVNGAAQIEAHLAPIFKDHPTARYVARVREIRQLSPDCALLRSVAGMIPPGKDEIMPERNAVQSLVAIRSGTGDWRIALFQNTPARFDGRPDEARKLTEELGQEVARETA
jgi:uncharacterized protein (TIGR02246 family)